MQPLDLTAIEAGYRADIDRWVGSRLGSAEKSALATHMTMAYYSGYLARFGHEVEETHANQQATTETLKAAKVALEVAVAAGEAND